MTLLTGHVWSDTVDMMCVVSLNAKLAECALGTFSKFTKNNIAKRKLNITVPVDSGCI